MAVAQKPAEDRVAARRGTLTHIVNRCEGSLGWIPSKNGRPLTGMERTRAIAIECSKLKREMAKNPKLFTISNLELSLEWCWHKRLRITSPVALIYHVADAVAEAARPDEPVDIMKLRGEAIEFEKALHDDDSDRWLRRLGRAQGAGLHDVIDQWQAARGR